MLYTVSDKSKLLIHTLANVCLSPSCFRNIRFFFLFFCSAFGSYSLFGYTCFWSLKWPIPNACSHSSAMSRLNFVRNESEKEKEQDAKRNTEKEGGREKKEKKKSNKNTLATVWWKFIIQTLFLIAVTFTIKSLYNFSSFLTTNKPI